MTSGCAAPADKATLDSADFATKLDAIFCHRSQCDVLFLGRPDCEELYARYAREALGRDAPAERLWTRAAPRARADP